MSAASPQNCASAFPAARAATGGTLLLLAWSLSLVPQATAESVQFLLQPTALLVGLGTALQFTFVPGLGYLSDDSTLLIAPECAGARFLVIAAVVGITASRSKEALGAEVRRISTTLGLSYVLTVIANASRITLLLLADQAGVPENLQLAGSAHEVIGALTYFTFLVLFAFCRGYSS